MGEFKTPEQIATAESALEKCRSSTDVQRVYFEHYLQVGHKVLGRKLVELHKSKIKS